LFFYSSSSKSFINEVSAHQLTSHITALFSVQAKKIQAEANLDLVDSDTFGSFVNYFIRCVLHFVIVRLTLRKKRRSKITG
jgi:hypothetical protein